jgi:signal transduction histidine kinase/CheY-like chemotaxis protein
MRARDALSPAVVRAASEARLSDVLDEIVERRATHAVVFDGDRFRGAVPLQSILYTAPQRIFADLVVRPPLPEVPADFPIESIGEHLEATGVDAIGVLDERGEHLGLVTQTSLLQALSDQARSRVSEIQRLRSQQERLRAVGQIACGITHDLNNLLTPIMGALELLEVEPTLSPSRRSLLRSAVTAASDTATAVRRLQQFYRRDDGSRKTSVRLDSLLRDAVSITRPRWRDEALRQGRRIKVEIESEDVGSIPANPGELREVLVNLLLNAVDAIRKEGVIGLRLRAENGSAVIEVSDSGRGMSTDEARRYFDPFYTTKGENGTGLGLSISREILEAHAGEIEAESRPGEGSLFRLRLPLEAAEPEPLAPADLVAPAAWKVLYVEDDARLRKVFTAMLARLGQRVEAVAGGREAISLLCSREFDLVVTDLTMPDMDGLELLARIKDERPAMPVVMVTGWGSDSSVFESRADVTPDILLHKPISLDELHRTLLGLQKGGVRA